MKVHINAFWLFGIVLLIPFSSCNEKRTDAAVQKNVDEQISDMQGYSAVQVNVRNGIVFMTGQCEGDGCAAQLAKQVEKLDGVQAVENDITEGKPPAR